MKTTTKHFQQFIKYFKDYQKRFGLNEYQVYFFHEKLEDSHAQLTSNEAGKVMRVSLDVDWKERPITPANLKQTALHECCHLLISRTIWMAGCRVINDGEVSEEDERLARKLTNILQDE